MFYWTVCAGPYYYFFISLSRQTNSYFTCDRCKIADFGLARSLTQPSEGSPNDTDPTLTDYVATRWYRAPEILIANRHYTKGIDMWSLGCILGEMIAGKPLFPGSSTVNQVEKIMATIPVPRLEGKAAFVHISGENNV